ncbi:lipoprotein [Pseudomonas citronellolis]|nr:lipoprotein [Pseudomonas citronellolis]
MSTALAAVIVTASGCTSYNVNQPSAPMDGVVSTDLKADVRVGEPITGQSSVNILFGFLKFGGDNQFADGVAYGGTDGGSLLSFDPVSSVKSAAAFKAVKSSGADLIVAPRYEVSVQDYFVFKKVDVKVTGNKGNIAGIR